MVRAFGSCCWYPYVMAKVEYRVSWRREDWREGNQTSKVFGTWAGVERMLQRLSSRRGRDGEQLAPAEWRVDIRDVGAWAMLDTVESIRGTLRPPVRAREERVEPVTYDPLAVCRDAVLAALADGGELSRAGLRRAVGMRWTVVDAAVAELEAVGLVTCRLGPRSARLCRLAEVAQSA